MVKITFVDNRLSVEGDEINEWEHSLFFSVIEDFEYDRSHNCYYSNDPDNLFSILQNTIDYLSSEGVNFQIDSNATKILQKIDNEQKEFKESYEAGLLAKTKTPDTNLIPNFKRNLKAYQQKGVEHLLAVKYGANFSVPGSGKTTVIFAVFALLKEKGIVDKLLVIGPRSSFLPWEEEAVACFVTPPPSIRLSGSKLTRNSIYLQSTKYELFLCTYQTATNDINELINFCKRHNVFVVIDESHNIKRIEGGRWSETILRLSRYASRRAILSGTPIPNSFIDLWTQITFLWPGEHVLGNREVFINQSDNKSYHQTIHNSIKPFYYRVTKSELGLSKPKFIRNHYLLAPYQQEIYNALSVKLLQQLDLAPTDRIILRQWRKAKMVRLIQAASNPTLLSKYSYEFDVPPLSGEGTSITNLIETYPKYEMPAKFQAVVKIVNSLIEEEEKVIIWTSFVHNIEMLKNLFTNVETFVVYGDVPKDENEDVEFNREQQIRDFKGKSGPSILIANPAACAESVSLHKVCHHAVYLDRTFNCGQYLQSLDRIHRVGLKPDEIVVYHILIADNTIDETIDRRLLEKEKTMSRILDEELPIGSFEVQENELAQTEEEEAADFSATIDDIKSKL